MSLAVERSLFAPPVLYRLLNGRKSNLLLLTGQFLTIASILLIVIVEEPQSGITSQECSLKLLLGLACLLGFGVVLAFRKFRVEDLRQKQLQQELRISNEEVVIALNAARDAIEARNQFLIKLSHRMQKPLKDIVRRSATLLEADLPDRQRGYAHRNCLAAESLTRAIANVLDYSQMEAGRLCLNNIEFDPAKLVNEITDDFSNRAQSAGLKLNKTIDEALATRVKGDPARLQQVLANLIDNALKYTQQGEIQVSASKIGSSEGRMKLQFAVKDTGGGITEQAREHLFQPFALPSGLMPSHNAEIGLGLATSKKLVELMGGTVEVESNRRGSVLRFTVVCECPRPTIGTIGIHTPVYRSTRPDRRTSPRYRVNHPTLLKSNEAGIAVVRVLDVSTTGLRVSMPCRLTLNTEVEVRVEGATIKGFVRNCVCKAAAEFYIGIEVSEATSVGGRSFDQVLRRTRA